MMMAATDSPAGSTTDPYFSLVDPLPPLVRENDHVLLHFADGRQFFAQAVPKWKQKGHSAGACKIAKRNYSTDVLIGLPYGTVLEVGRDALVPLPAGEGLLADTGLLLGEVALRGDTTTTTKANEDKDGLAATFLSVDNRHLHDAESNQNLTPRCIADLRERHQDGSRVVAALVKNSATFAHKTAFSQAKYLRQKQMKHHVRCRVVRVTPSTLCAALHARDSRRICNLREDTLGQLLSNANVHAGQRVLVADTDVLGIVSASAARRLGGYGSVYSLFVGQQPGYVDLVNKMNLTAGERQSLKWIGMGEVFADPDDKARQVAGLGLVDEGNTGSVRDVERQDREKMDWPCELQDHTRNHLRNNVKSDRGVDEFLAKRAARFTRKLTRHTVLELREMIDGCKDKSEDYVSMPDGSMTSSRAAVGCGSSCGKKEKKKPREEEEEEEEGCDDDGSSEAKEGEDDGIPRPRPRQCDSLIIATRYDPTAMLLRLLPYLAPSCPFVVYHEFLEPLLETFRTLQSYRVSNDVDEKDDDDAAATDKQQQQRTQTTTKQPMMLRRNVAVNLRLTDAWFREYQVLEGRTHPVMSMSQNGGYILTGTKLCPRTGTNELDEVETNELKARLSGERRQQRKASKEGKKKLRAMEEEARRAAKKMKKRGTEDDDKGPSSPNGGGGGERKRPKVV